MNDLRAPFALTLLGEPSSKERPRHTKKGHTYTPAKTRAAEREIAEIYQFAGGPLITGDVAIELDFYTRRLTKDLDNMLKLVLDALNEIAYADDRQIVMITVTKRLAPIGNARTELRIREWVLS